MTKRRRNKILALALAALMVFALAACSASSSSTSTTTITTSTTDENGNTTTNTTTTEVGVTAGTDGVSANASTNTETTTDADDADPEAEAEDLTRQLYERYNVGGKGSNADGDVFYYACNSDNDNMLLAIMTADHSNFSNWQGYIDELDGQAVLTGYSEDKYIPFDLEQTEDDVFTLSFPENGDVADMEVMDFDEFVDDFVNAWVYFD